MDIKRDIYLNRLISFMWDGQVKVITGIRRCGKSYLLRTIFKRYLLEQGVAEDHILSYELDLAKDIQYRNPLELAKAVRERVEGQPDRWYLFVDEIRVHPLRFAEYYAAVGGDKAEAFEDYAFFGGMPLILSRPDDTAKMNYLNGIWTSPASASLISQFQSLRPVFHSYLQAIETYVQFLQQTAASYQENEQQLASRIQ